MPIPVYSRCSPLMPARNSSNSNHRHNHHHHHHHHHHHQDNHQNHNQNDNPNNQFREEEEQHHHQLTDMAAKETNRPPLFPLQDATWNSGGGSLSVESAKIDPLTTPNPRSVVKWLSSTPLPDPFFDSFQENLSITVPPPPNPNTNPNSNSLLPTSLSSAHAISPDQPKLLLQAPAAASSASVSLQNSFRQKLSMKESTSSARSSALSSNDPVIARSNSLGQDTTTTSISRTHSLDQRNFNVGTPIPAMNYCESDGGSSVGDMPVARSLKYGAFSQAPSISTSSSVHFEIEEDPNFWKEHNIQVVIRLRPLNSSELSTQGQSRCVRQESAHAITWTGHPESRFTFDNVACESITQEKLFRVAGQPMVDNCLLGYNSCMFAYGQTGSGKTFTMLGELEDADHRPSDKRGMTPRVFEYLFSRITEEEETRKTEALKFTCKCSFLEIYNEHILDLLDPSTNLQMREDARKGVYVENLSEVDVKSVHDVIRLLLQGAANRKVAATNMNRESSRSHSVFTCVIESKWTSQSITSSRYGRLNLVDLAGSERQKSSGAEGERLKEASNINKSLSTLGLVIMSLVDIANGKQRHVPYRDSKLTFLLHDSLGGNSKTTIIANISPSNCCALETLSTLKFAQRAKFIRNNAVVNENASGDVMALRLQIQQLKQEVNRLRLQSIGSGGDGMVITDGEQVTSGTLTHPAYSLESWDSFRAFSTPASTIKNKSGLEAALIGSLRREQAGEARIRQLHTEIDLLKRLVKQREEDSQCGKMMLRFREDKIKRLESAVAGLTPMDTYLLQEKNSLLEEVQILRNRLERNPEVTRFAMENIRLLEDLRRFQEFYEAGERDAMLEEISILRDQLYEALDWKLMHEQNNAKQAQVTLLNDGNKDEVDSSKLEEQIETVGAVASMQAELIAMRETLVSTTNSEMEARERASMLSQNVESLQRELKELQARTAMYECELTEKNLAIAELTRVNREAGEGACPTDDVNAAPEQASALMQEIDVLQGQLISLREENSSQRDKHVEALANIQQLTRDLELEIERRAEDVMENENKVCAMSKEIEDLERKIRDLQDESSMHQTTISEKDAAIEKLKREINAKAAEHSAVLTEMKDRDLLFAQEIENLGMQIKNLTDENASLHDLELGRLAIIEKLTRDAEVANEIASTKILELQCALEAAQSPSENVETPLKEELHTQMDIENGDACTLQMQYLQDRVETLQQEKSNLLDVYERSREESDIKINELRVSLTVVQAALESMTHQVKMLSKEVVSSFDVDKFVSGWMEKFERRYGSFTVSVNKIEAALENMKHDADVFASMAEKLIIELLSAIDETSIENQKLMRDLERTQLKLRDAEQARDDVCLLSSVEKGAWADEKKTMQENVERASCLFRSREKAWHNAIIEFQAKLDLVEEKLAEIFSMVDEQEQEGLTPSRTLVELLRAEAEVKVLEERHDSVMLKLKQKNNKVNALREVLSKFCSSKQDWSNREEMIENEVSVLSNVLAEKGKEICTLQKEEENLRCSLDQLLKEEELMLIEAEALKERLSTEKVKIDGEDSEIAQSAFSMLQLLRVEEEKATLLSMISVQEEKLKNIKDEIEDMSIQVEQKETALLCAQVKWEEVAGSLQQAESELEEIKKEKHLLIDADSEARSEFDELASALSKVEDEARELEEQLKSSRDYFYELKKGVSEQVDVSSPSASVNDGILIKNLKEGKTTLSKMLSDGRKLFVEMTSNIARSAQD